jgi:hypothetical protein
MQDVLIRSTIATTANLGGARCREEERQLFSGGVPASAPSAGLSVRRLGRRPLILPRGLEDLA